MVITSKMKEREKKKGKRRDVKAMGIEKVKIIKLCAFLPFPFLPLELDSLASTLR